MAGNGRNDKLPDLPKSNTRFWDKADKFQRDVSTLPTCEHYFEVRGKEIVCRNCNIGYIRDGRVKVKKGKLVV